MTQPSVAYVWADEYTDDDIRELMTDAILNRKIPAHCTKCGYNNGNREMDLRKANCSKCGGTVQSILVIKGLI